MRLQRDTTPTTRRLGTPIFDYDLPGLAYRLPVVDDRIGPVLGGFDRRLTAVGDARIGRRSTDEPRPTSSVFEGPSEGRQLAVIGGVTLVAVLIGFGVTLIPSNSPTRALADSTKAVRHSPQHHTSPAAAAGTGTAKQPAHGTRARAATHQASHRHHHAATVSHRTTEARHTQVHTTSTPTSSPTTTATTTAPADTTPTPVTTRTAPVQTAPTPTHTTPAPTHTTPAPTHTTPGGTGSSGTSGSSSAGTSSSGSSGGSGTVSGGG
jgi:uncharacterized membrane protein YgcG